MVPTNYAGIVCSDDTDCVENLCDVSILLVVVPMKCCLLVVSLNPGCEVTFGVGRLNTGCPLLSTHRPSRLPRESASDAKLTGSRGPCYLDLNTGTGTGDLWSFQFVALLRMTSILSSLKFCYFSFFSTTYASLFWVTSCAFEINIEYYQGRICAVRAAARTTVHWDK